MVNPTNPPSTIYPYGEPVDKVLVRQWMNEMISGIAADIMTETNRAKAAETLLATNIGRIFRSRAEAVAFGQENLPPSTGIIAIVDGDNVEFRHPGWNETRDPLFAVYPTWGVLSVQNTLGTMRRAGVIELADAVVEPTNPRTIVCPVPPIIARQMVGQDGATIASLTASMSTFVMRVPENLDQSETDPVSHIRVRIGDWEANLMQQSGFRFSVATQALQIGRYILIRRHGNQLRVMGGDVDMAYVSNAIATAMVGVGKDTDVIRAQLNDIAAVANGTLETTPLASIMTQAGFRLWNSFSEPASDLVPAPGWSTSDLIHVKRGECYCMNIPTRSYSFRYNFVAIYGTDEAPVGSLAFGNSSLVTDAAALNAAYALTDDPTRQNRKYMRIPQDGFIRVSCLTNDVPSAFLRRITDEEFYKSITINISAKMVDKLRKMDAIYTTPLVTLGRGYQGVTVPQATIDEQPRGMGAMVPVVAGQRLHLFASAGSVTPGQTPAIAAIFDSAGTLTRVLTAYNGHGGRYINQNWRGGVLCVQNFKVPENGFVQLIACHVNPAFDDTNYLFVTDDWLDYEYDYMKPGDVPTRVTGVRNYNSPGLQAGFFAEYDTIGPVFLAPGQIAKITVTHPTMASVNPDAVVCWVDGPDNVDQGAMVRGVPFMELFQNALVPNGYTSVRYVKADKYPHVINAPTATGTGSVEIISQEQAIAERNKFFAETLAWKTGVIANNSWPAGAANAANNNLALGYLPVFSGEALRIALPQVQVDGGSFVYEPASDIQPADGRGDEYINLPWQVYAGAATNVGDGSKPEYFIRPREGRSVYYGCVANEGREIGLTIDRANGVYPQIITETEYKAMVNVAEGYMREKVLNVMPAALPDGNPAMGVTSTLVSWGPGGRWSYLSMPIYVRAGECIEWWMNTENQNRRCAIAFWRDPATGAKVSQYLLHGPGEDSITPQPEIGYWKATYDSVVFVISIVQGDEAPSATSRLINAHAGKGVRFITEDEYLFKTTPQFTGDTLNLPDLNGVEFKFVNGFMPFVRSGPYNLSMMEIWQNGAFVTSIQTRNEVQGQASANDIKKNIDIKGYNRAGKRIKFKVQDWKLTNKLVLKANLNERTQTRDSLGAEIWRQARREHPFPNNKIWDPVLTTRVATFPEAAFMQDAVCSTQGASVSVFYGKDFFYGIYQLRTKKDELNYGIKEETYPYIWMQSDRLIFEGESNIITWPSFNWRQWEVTQPAIGGYEPGYPHPDHDTSAAILRFFNWISDALAQTVSFADTYADYIVLDSWIDYLLTCEAIRHWDAEHNNIIVSTYDAVHWSIHIYDMDQVLGNNAVSPTASTAFQDADAGLFRCLYRDMKPQLDARWAELRQSVFTVGNFEKMVWSEANKLSHERRMQDTELWGPRNGNDFNFMVDWFRQRLAYLDERFNYSET